MLQVMIILSLLLSACAPATFNPPVEQPYHFEDTPQYDVEAELEKIQKPEPLEPVFAKLVNQSADDISFEIVSNPEDATHILLTGKEFAKVGAVVKLAKTYKEVAIEQETLVNTYVTQINAYKELVELERQKTIYYRELWVQSENAYRQERYNHNLDNLISRIGLYLTTLGAIALLVIL